jgi:hypothetical protein
MEMNLRDRARGWEYLYVARVGYYVNETLQLKLTIGKVGHCYANVKRSP